VFFENLVGNPEAEVSRIYEEMGLELSDDFHKILYDVAVNSRNYTGHGNYSLDRMGVDIESLKKEFSPDLKAYQNNVPKAENLVVKGKG